MICPWLDFGAFADCGGVAFRPSIAIAAIAKKDRFIASLIYSDTTFPPFAACSGFASVPDLVLR